MTGVMTDLEYDRTLKHYEHEQCEQAVVPVFIQAPQPDAENLKNKERGRGVLGEQRREGWDGNVKFVLSVQS
jgi:hypothetical protein